MIFTVAQTQLNLGAIGKNFSKCMEIWHEQDGKSDLIIFPELALTGYPLEDLVENLDFLKACDEVLQEILTRSCNLKSAIAITHPIRENKKIYNALLLIESGKILAKIYKSYLPNYGVFDEKRNFSRGRNNNIVEWRGKKIGFLICEDIWKDEIPAKLAAQGAEIFISLNASPYDIHKAKRRANLANRIVKNHKLPLIYVNSCGAQDELVFDGGSFIMNTEGKYIVSPSFWQEKIINSDFTKTVSSGFCEESTPASIYNALILGLRSYIINNRFKKAIIGVSGGIDSALVATIAADAVGPENLILVKLPSKYSSNHSILDAESLAKNLGVNPIHLPIQKSVDVVLAELSPHFGDVPSDITEENLQSRIRGIMLMALSNKSGAILLSTGNKSEYACGYATIYGDMCGGFAPIKDIYKTQVYDLCRYRNKNMPMLSCFEKLDVIPENSILKPPSAELSHGQLDTDTLPEYNVLDKILYELVENNQSIEAVVEMGYNRELIIKIYKMLKISEYKRRQAPLGTKISIKNFSKDRRYPVTNQFEIL
ncbi:MAG: NH(3)-dependent synthetase [Candidatus Midichloriaceae bacterium]|jgi:NAD+ synthase|nr:NH(3)-dependent synthetase [Candidatus Midichloriaceae bacterium]